MAETPTAPPAPSTSPAPVVCPHLQPVLAYVLSRGAKVTFAGQAWSRNCRMWVYVDHLLDVAALMRRLSLGPPVEVHTHRGTHDGSEHGLVCTEHNDAVMGPHPEVTRAAAIQ